MITFIDKKRPSLFYKCVCSFVAFTFIFSSVIPPQTARAQVVPAASLAPLNLPAPGTMVPLSRGYVPAMLKGMTIHPENPLQFDFVVDTGDSGLQIGSPAFNKESTKLIKYFLAALTVPEDELWVNLSPTQKDRIMPEGFGITEMGRDMLAQDYILKQLTASLMYPEDELGQKFWDKVYSQAYEKYGTTEVPVDTFHKVWIVPEHAFIYEQGAHAFVAQSHLKVMLEDDYDAMVNQKSMAESRASARDEATLKGKSLVSEDETRDNFNSAVTTQIIRDILIPAIEAEVNEGENFADLRQIFNAIILAKWYKMNLKESLLGQVYVDQNKTKGVDIEDKQAKEKIYGQYMAAFKKGVFNYIREDADPATKGIIPRKYFSGGTSGRLEQAGSPIRVDNKDGKPGKIIPLIAAGLVVTVGGVLGASGKWDFVKRNPEAFAATATLPNSGKSATAQVGVLATEVGKEGDYAIEIAERGEVVNPSAILSVEGKEGEVTVAELMDSLRETKRIAVFQAALKKLIDTRDSRTPDLLKELYQEFDEQYDAKGILDKLTSEAKILTQKRNSILGVLGETGGESDLSFLEGVAGGSGLTTNVPTIAREAIAMIERRLDDQRLARVSSFESLEEDYNDGLRWAGTAGILHRLSVVRVMEYKGPEKTIGFLQRVLENDPAGEIKYEAQKIIERINKRETGPASSPVAIDEAARDEYLRMVERMTMIINAAKEKFDFTQDKSKTVYILGEVLTAAEDASRSFQRAVKEGVLDKADLEKQFLRLHSYLLLAKEMTGNDDKVMARVNALIEVEARMSRSLASLSGDSSASPVALVEYEGKGREKTIYQSEDGLITLAGVQRDSKYESVFYFQKSPFNSRYVLEVVDVEGSALHIKLYDRATQKVLTEFHNVYIVDATAEKVVEIINQSRRGPYQRIYFDRRAENKITAEKITLEQFKGEVNEWKNQSAAGSPVGYPSRERLIHSPERRLVGEYEGVIPGASVVIQVSQYDNSAHPGQIETEIHYGRQTDGERFLAAKDVMRGDAEEIWKEIVQWLGSVDFERDPATIHDIPGMLFFSLPYAFPYREDGGIAGSPAGVPGQGGGQAAFSISQKDVLEVSDWLTAYPEAKAIFEDAIREATDAEDFAQRVLAADQDPYHRVGVINRAMAGKTNALRAYRWALIRAMAWRGDDGSRTVLDESEVTSEIQGRLDRKRRTHISTITEIFGLEEKQVRDIVRRRLSDIVEETTHGGDSGLLQHKRPTPASSSAASPVVGGETVEQNVSAPGGIDLNPELLDLQIKRDGNGVPLPVNLQPMETMHIEGFVPIIIHVAPVNLPLLLGFADENGPTPLADESPDSPLDAARNEHFEEVVRVG